ncbi:Neuroligin-4, Y-linked [Orchesella cincta]|uniref:Neuroligin-4, Y-linked n=1 Tax=Orchesella cincta TaxID=48709 RepID=A0A1D2NKL5_ORCCI|nr:Neuroligin-4, Y-linked [Orchesella cincta]
MNCSRLVWILLVLVSIPVGPHNQVLFIHSQSLTRQWSTRVVSTKQGLTRGFLFLPRGHEGVEVFLGIPYASPPLGSLRLMPPVSGSPWTGIKTNEQPPPVCPQVLPWGLGSPESANLTEDEEALKWMPRGRLSQLKRLFPFLSNQSEDCLYLNIYVPLSVADGREDKVLPVLVFIHGEDFGYGAGNPYDPSMLVSQGNLIAVTLNYRLGILAFGGDVKRISLMGQGKGAAFVNFLMISNALPKANSAIHFHLRKGKM